MSKCRYCGFYSEILNKNEYGELLNAEITELKKIKLQKPLNTIYIGGGSPSCLGEKTLCGFLENIIKITGSPKEFTVEVNPAQTDKSMLKNLRTLGVNRLSIGAQSFCDEQLAMLGRGHNARDITRTVESAHTAGFENIGLDLIFALPGSNLKSWKETLKKTIDCKVQHISAYALSYENGTKFMQMKKAGKLRQIDEELDRKMYETAIEMLNNAGLSQYEISNFARNGFKCKHNLLYWNDGNYRGIGPAAATHCGNERWNNIADIEKYITAIQSGKNAANKIYTTNKKEAACEKMVLAMRKIKGENIKKFKHDTGFDAYELFSETINKYHEMKMIKIENGFISLTKKTLAIADSVLTDFANPD